MFDVVNAFFKFDLFHGCLSVFYEMYRQAVYDSWQQFVHG